MLRTLSLCISFFVFGICFGQKSDQENYFLIDEIDTSVFADNDIEVLTYYLNQYHSTKDPVEKLELIEELLMVFYEETTWHSYNLFLLDESKSLTETAVNEKQREEAYRYYGIALNNEGFVYDIFG